MERSDFDSRMTKLLIKTAGVHQLKLLTYFLISFDWSASLDFNESRDQFLKNSAKIIHQKKSEFQNEEECYIHKLGCKIIDLIEVFLHDRPQIQTIISKPHNYTKIVSMLGRGSCEFQGMVYMNRQIDYLCTFLASLIDFDLRYPEVFDTSTLALFVTKLITIYYNFFAGVLGEFKSKVEKIGNQTLTLEFYDCYTEFRGNTKLLSKLYGRSEYYFKNHNVSKIDLMGMDLEQEASLDKSFFELKKQSSRSILPTNIGSLS